MGECNTILSAYTLCRHLVSHSLVELQKEEKKENLYQNKHRDLRNKLLKYYHDLIQYNCNLGKSFSNIHVRYC